VEKGGAEAGCKRSIAENERSMDQASYRGEEGPSSLSASTWTLELEENCGPKMKGGTGTDYEEGSDLRKEICRT